MLTRDVYVPIIDIDALQQFGAIAKWLPEKLDGCQNQSSSIEVRCLDCAKGNIKKLDLDTDSWFVEMLKGFSTKRVVEFFAEIVSDLLRQEQTD